MWAKVVASAVLAATAMLAAAAPAAAAAAGDPDSTRRALALQYELAGDVPLRNAPWVYTHNSFNSVAEMGPTLSDQDPNQQITIVDQLDEGVRHLEIDTHLFASPSDPRVGPQGPVVCHATDPAVGCTAEKPLVVVLRQIRGWLDRHRDQVLLLYLESHLQSEAGYDAGAASIEEALGGRVYRPPSEGAKCDGMPLELTREQVLAAGRQVLAIGPCGEGTRWPSYVFDEEARQTGSDNAPFADFPGCGPDYTRAEYDAAPIRYYEDGTQLTKTAGGGATDPITAPIAARMIRCGVDLIGFDHLLHGDARLESLVWSWAPGQPRGAGNCSVQRADGRWESRPCSEHHRVACRTDAGGWVVPPGRAKARSAARRCSTPGLANAVPRTGFEGQLLRVAATGAGARNVWLGQRRRATGWELAETRGCGPALRQARRRWPVRRGVAAFRVRLRFACTRQRLVRRLTVRGAAGRVRSRTGRLVRVPVRPGTRRLRVSFAYRGERRAVTVLLRR